MVSSTIDHMVAVTVFLAATLLFIGLFNQTIQTAVIYQRHRATATKASDLLDNMLLSPGIPINWGQTDGLPTGFGLQDPEFTQYKLSPYSLMRLISSSESVVYYPKTNSTYTTVSYSPNGYMFVATGDCVDYATASRLLGINGSYGFQLTVTPTVSVSINRISLDPLNFTVEVGGMGSPLSGANLDYYLCVTTNDGSEDPVTQMLTGVTQADQAGLAVLDDFSSVTDTVYAYSIIVNARLSGLRGVGYDSYDTMTEPLLVPLIDSFEDGRVLLAHLWDIYEPSGGKTAALHYYNVTFLTLTSDSELRPVEVVTEGPSVINSGTGKPYAEVQLPSTTDGILLVPYQRGDEDEYGVMMMPWGVSALAFPVVFGGDPSLQEWVATDMRQVTVGGMAYQAKLAVWSLEGYQVIG
jgi:hypothetical protein